MRTLPSTPQVGEAVASWLFCKNIDFKFETNEDGKIICHGTVENFPAKDY